MSAQDEEHPLVTWAKHVAAGGAYEFGGYTFRLMDSGLCERWERTTPSGDKLTAPPILPAWLRPELVTLLPLPKPVEPRSGLAVRKWCMENQHRGVRGSRICGGSSDDSWHYAWSVVSLAFVRRNRDFSKVVSGEFDGDWVPSDGGDW